MVESLEGSVGERSVEMQIVRGGRTFSSSSFDFPFLFSMCLVFEVSAAGPGRTSVEFGAGGTELWGRDVDFEFRAFSSSWFDLPFGLSLRFALEGLSAGIESLGVGFRAVGVDGTGLWGRDVDFEVREVSRLDLAVRGAILRLLLLTKHFIVDLNGVCLWTKVSAIIVIRNRSKFFLKTILVSKEGRYQFACLVNNIRGIK